MIKMGEDLVGIPQPLISCVGYMLIGKPMILPDAWNSIYSKVRWTKGHGGKWRPMSL